MELGRGDTVAPGRSQEAGASLETGSNAPEPDAPLEHVAPPEGPPPVEPGAVRRRPEGHPEGDQREPRLAAPEPSAPTIRVSIGRIEVRAVTPPPMLPERRDTPARPGPALSLDDYLKERNEGRR
ncbi:MAG: hypothetical protein M3328_08720 [Chloroflexota bacterium]|nr:hypothetical protein [Chloroflexota bacterium]